MTAKNGFLAVDYSTFEDSRIPYFKTCIRSKSYPLSLKQKGYVGITAGNPLNQNVNDIEVESIDFFNMNAEFY